MAETNAFSRREQKVSSGSPKKGITYALWTIQVLLSLVFLFAGGVKLVMPIEEMAKQVALPAWFLHFIGVAEVLGGLGLVLPGLLRIRPGLTPVAASGLVIIMIGAVVVSLQIGPATMALVPLVLGLLLIFVAYRRAEWIRG
jgi:hypothetical protein